MLAAVTQESADRDATAGIIPDPAARGDGVRGWPDTPLALQLASLWEELLGGGPVRLEDDFFARGGGSLGALRLAREAEERLGLELPLDAFLEGATLARLVAALGRARPVADDGLVCLRPGRAGVPLLLVHPAGGSALCYLALARQLAWSRPIYALREPLALAARGPSLVERASAYVSLLEGLRPGAQWCLAGHSFGGLVAFEAARQLAARGASPRAVVLIDATAPGQAGVRDEDALVRRLADALEGADLDASGADPRAEARLWETLREVAAVEGPRLAPGARRVRLGDLERFCRRLGFVPERGALDYSELRGLLLALRAALRSARDYAPGPYAGRVLLLQAEQAPAGWHDAQARRWRRLAPRLETRSIPGHHLDLLGEPHVAALAACLGQLLDALDGATS